MHHDQEEQKQPLPDLLWLRCEELCTYLLLWHRQQHHVGVEDRQYQHCPNGQQYAVEFVVPVGKK